VRVRARVKVTSWSNEQSANGSTKGGLPSAVWRRAWLGLGLGLGIGIGLGLGLGWLAVHHLAPGSSIHLV
jgi:hypothetical protein